MGKTRSELREIASKVLYETYILDNAKIKYDINTIEQIVRYHIFNYINTNDLIKKDVKMFYTCLMDSYINPINIEMLCKELNGDIKEIIDIYKHFIVHDCKYEEEIYNIKDYLKKNNELIKQCSRKLKLYI